MQPTSVFAAASSRLHADLMVIRLKRAGIPRGQLSIVYPEDRKPNCVSCWIQAGTRSRLFGNETVTVAGPLHQHLDLSSEPALVRSLSGLGLSANDACTCADLLGRGRILVGVHAASEPEAAIAWHTYKQLEAEGIAVGLSDLGIVPLQQTNASPEEVPLDVAV